VRRITQPTAADASRIYRALRRIRRVEEEVARVYPTDKVKSPVHLSIGQEAVAVGVCDVLRPDDVTTMSYRGHATYLAKGGDLRAMIAELYGKVTGCGRGKAGSMHLVDMASGVLGASAVVATTIPLGVGYALALKREGKGRVVASFFGDGATEEGVFSESVNFAALKRLPILFVLEDNGFAIHVPRAKRWATDNIVERMQSYGLRTAAVNDGDVFAIRAAAADAIAAMRAGGGPAFLACKTYRWGEHVGPGDDLEASYRDHADLAHWKANDAVRTVGELLGADERRRLDAEIEEEIAEAFAFAEMSAFPGPEELHEHLFAH
jgi:TPP-dependent pyruvate/acetoin dehydrogenase alpha subunit